MRNEILTIILGIAIVCASCSSARIAANRIDPTNPTDDLKPVDAIHDAAIVKDIPFLPEVIAAKILRAAQNKAQVPSDLLRDIQDTLCDSKKMPRFAPPTYKIKFIIPKNAGEALDLAQEKRIKLVELAREYLKTKFFHNGSEEVSRQKSGRVESVSFNDDYEHYLEAINSGNDTKLRGLKVNVPVVSSANKKDIENFYKNLRYAHDFSEMRWKFGDDEDDWHIQTQFLAVMFQDKTAILVPKVVNMLSVGWGKSYGKPEPANVALAVPDKDANFNLFTRVHFAPSEYGWDFDGKGKWHTLQISVMQSLAFLRQLYTFVLPKGVIADVLNRRDMQELQHLGYNFETEKFSADSAIRNQPWLWQKMLGANKVTTLKEAPQKDGSIEFELSSNIMDYFCRYAFPISSLRSE